MSGVGEYVGIGPGFTSTSQVRWQEMHELRNRVSCLESAVESLQRKTGMTHSPARNPWAGYRCDGCGSETSVGPRYSCTECFNTDYCELCVRHVQCTDHAKLRIDDCSQSVGNEPAYNAQRRLRQPPPPPVSMAPPAIPAVGRSEPDHRGGARLMSISAAAADSGSGQMYDGPTASLASSAAYADPARASAGF